MRASVARVILFVLTGAFVLGCYPSGPEFVEDLDVVYSSYDEDFDFQSRSTYAMPDKIVIDVDIDNGDTTYVYMKDVFAQPIFDAIEANMTALGWDPVDISADPNVVLTPAAMSSTTYFYSYWYDWWWGGYYPGWGWYYPPYYTVSSYTTGTLIITMSDPNIDHPINQSRAAWIAAAQGVYTGNYNVQRVTDAIDQAFSQSPYLQTN